MIKDKCFLSSRQERRQGYLITSIQHCTEDYGKCNKE